MSDDPDPDRDPLAARRRKLGFRSWHRGTREADLLLGSFADRHLGTFDSAQLDRFEALLENNDPDLYNWMMGREPIPSDQDNDVMRLLRDHRFGTKAR